MNSIHGSTAGTRRLRFVLKAAFAVVVCALLINWQTQRYYGGQCNGPMACMFLLEVPCFGRPACRGAALARNSARRRYRSRHAPRVRTQSHGSIRRDFPSRTRQRGSGQVHPAVPFISDRARIPDCVVPDGQNGGPHGYAVLGRGRRDPAACNATGLDTRPVYCRWRCNHAPVASSRPSIPRTYTGFTPCAQ